MRKTVYVRDDLIERVRSAGHDERFSELVQNGLEALIRMPANRPAFARKVELREEERARWDRLVTRMVAQTQEEYKNGATEALKIAERITWSELAALESHAWDISKWALERQENREDGVDDCSLTLRELHGFDELGDHISGPFGLGMRETFRALHQAVFGSEIESTQSLSDDEPNDSDDAKRRRPTEGEQADVR